MFRRAHAWISHLKWQRHLTVLFAWSLTKIAPWLEYNRMSIPLIKIALHRTFISGHHPHAAGVHTRYLVRSTRLFYYFTQAGVLWHVHVVLFFVRVCELNLLLINLIFDDTLHDHSLLPNRPTNLLLQRILLILFFANFWALWNFLGLVILVNVSFFNIWF